jgi:hypothetical protein
MKVKDKRTGKFERIVDKTNNSFCITQAKLSKYGINCTQWFTEQEFVFDKNI